MMIKDRMVARPSRTNLRFIQKPKKAFFLQRPPWREQESRPQRDNHRKQPEFLPCPHVCLLYGKLLRERLDRSTILGGFLQSELSFPAPFTFTTTMLEAFVEEEASLTLDRSVSRLTLIAGQEVTKLGRWHLQ